MSKPRPIIDAVTLNEFGDVNPEALMAPGMSAPDATYTPGWSELRHQRELDVKEYRDGTRAAKDVRTLPGNLRLVRRTKAGAQDPDVGRQTWITNAGYRPVTKRDIGQPWLTAMPPGAYLLPDGSIAKGDCVYMYAEQQTAALNRARSHQELARQFDQADGWMEAVGAIEGTKPEKTEERGEPIKIQS